GAGRRPVPWNDIDAVCGAGGLHADRGQGAPLTGAPAVVGAPARGSGMPAAPVCAAPIRRAADRFRPFYNRGRAVMRRPIVFEPGSAYMRQIILDTETTGLDPAQGHRIVEVACVEMVNRSLTGNHLHLYLNPDRDSDPEALAVHGLTTEFLSTHPRFSEIAHHICDFVQGAEVIIHNAAFDLKFLDAELQRVGRPAFSTLCGKITDSLLHARELHPGKRNSLDALCERYGISNAHRTLHGALLDSE